MQFRPAAPADSDRIIALLDGIYREYGDRVCLEGSEADLNNLPAHYGDGEFMVLEDADRIVGTVALTPCDKTANVCWLKRMYLAPDLRGAGVAPKLIDWARDRARALGRTRIQCWSDVRFERAHAFYRKMGFTDTGERRRMTDAFEPYEEFFFSLDLD